MVAWACDAAGEPAYQLKATTGVGTCMPTLTELSENVGLFDMQNGSKPDLPKSSVSSHLHRQQFTCLSPAPSLASPK